MIIIPNLRALEKYVGKEMGKSDPILITQDLVNRFASCTFDEQWIHTDPIRAKNESPFGSTIAHGYLIISLNPKLASSVYQVDSLTRIINYGSDKVRFISPIPVGSSIYLSITIKSLNINPNGSKLIAEGSFFIEGSDKPACISENIMVLYE
jgi:acyl dehydratase